MKKSGNSKIFETAIKNAHTWVAPFAEIPREEAGDVTTFFIGTTPYAVVEVAGATLKFRLRRPNDLTGLEAKLEYYVQEEVEEVVWLAFEMPANNKPQPALEAGLGRFCGTIIRELREAQNV